MPIISFSGKKPFFDHTVWIAPNAYVIGDVYLGTHSSIWFGATVRGDIATIAIGQGTNIQDGSILHTEKTCPLTIGNHVTVGHLVTLHGCTIGNNTLIGMGAIILNGATIGNHCLVGAGSLITERKNIPDYSLVMGQPAKIIRQLTEKELAEIEDNANRYIRRAQQYQEEENV